MAKFCINCGRPLDEAVKFCAGCGAPQPYQQPQPQPQPQPYQQLQQPPPQQQYASAPVSPATRKRKKPLIIGGITGACALALAIALVATNGFGLFKKSNSGSNPGGSMKPSSTSGNNGNNSNNNNDGKNNPNDPNYQNGENSDLFTIETATAKPDPVNDPIWMRINGNMYKVSLDLWGSGDRFDRIEYSIDYYPDFAMPADMPAEIDPPAGVELFADYKYDPQSIMNAEGDRGSFSFYVVGMSESDIEAYYDALKQNGWSRSYGSAYYKDIQWKGESWSCSIDDGANWEGLAEFRVVFRRS